MYPRYDKHFEAGDLILFHGNKRLFLVTETFERIGNRVIRYVVRWADGQLQLGGLEGHKVPEIYESNEEAMKDFMQGQMGLVLDTINITNLKDYE